MQRLREKLLALRAAWSRLRGRLADNAANLLTTAALAAIAAGCWLERPSLGLIVPGMIVFGCLAYRRIRRDD